MAVAAVVLTVQFAQTQAADQGTDVRGRYEGVNASANAVWVIDTRSGTVQNALRNLPTRHRPVRRCPTEGPCPRPQRRPVIEPRIPRYLSPEVAAECACDRFGQCLADAFAPICSACIALLLFAQLLFRLDARGLLGLALPLLCQFRPSRLASIS